jgi:DNA repair exonuclease SbcCD ATPase subunit
MKRSVAVLTLTVAALAIGLVARTPGVMTAAQVRQAAPPEADVLPALLTEVRGLRAAMERMASAGPRVQLALGRVQLQEQRINNLIRRLDEMRTALAADQAEYDRLREVSRGIEAALRNPPPDGPPIEELKTRLEAIPRELALALTKLQRATADEAALAADLANEQARWTDLNQRMEALEATLATGGSR